MKEVTIEITNYCPQSCSYCSTKAGPEGTLYLSLDAIQKFMDGKTWDRINLSGGEPLAHPDFWKILQLSKKHVTERTGLVCVYTNALESIRFNASVIPGVRVEANLPVLPNTAEVHLLKMRPQGYEGKRPDVHYSSNWAGECKECNHPVLRPDGKLAVSPCAKEVFEE